MCDEMVTRVTGEGFVRAGIVRAFRIIHAAGAMLESVTGKTWESLMQEEIFDPLKMNSAGFGPPKRITGHTTSNGKLIPAKFDNPEALGPAGTVHCSLDDWGKFLSVHLGKMDGVLQPETLSRLHAPPPGSTYAMGWIVNDLGERGVLLSHDGSNTLWYARVILIPKQDVMILVALNSNNVEACEAATQLAVRELQK